MSRPNILIFCTDEQRGDYLGCMGHPHVKTPQIDRIAAEGTLFRNCYSSGPICMPARATMFTGLSNRQHGVVRNGIALDKSLPTMPGILADAGYRTHAVGKLHLQGRGGRTIDPDEDITQDPERRIYWDWPGHWKGEHYKKFPDNYYGLQTVELAQGHVNYIFGDYVTWLEENHPGAYAGYKCNNADPHPLAIDSDLHYNTWIADRSIAFIKEQAESPFFLWCSFPDPHEPFAAVKKWSDFYDDVEIELPENTLSLSPDSRSEMMNQQGLGTEVIDPELVRKSIKQTYGMISHIDENVGRVLDCLEEKGIADNTIVIFIADHGDQLGEHGLFYKGVYPYNAHAHIPFLVKVPGGKAGAVVDDVVSMLDLVPTVLDLAGIPYPLQIEDAVSGTRSVLPGEVLTPVLMDGSAPERKQAIVEVDGSNGPCTIQLRSLVTHDYKIVFYPQIGETMLFDRRNDPQEIKNLAAIPEYQPVVLEMMKKLLAELARTENPGHRLLTDPQASTKNQ